MEVKLSHKKHFLLSKSLLSDHTKASFPPRTLNFKPWAAAEIQRFQGLVKKWRLQNETKDYSCGHVVKEGETLSSISKMYGVSVHSIAAANKNIVDIDLVFQGQLLNIPAPSLLDTKFDRVKKSKLWRSIRALKVPSEKTLFTVLTSHHQSNARSTGYFLVVVPLIAFCIGCVISTFHTRVARGIRQQAVDKSQALHCGAKRMRWKYALSDTVEGNVFDSELGLDSISRRMLNTCYIGLGIAHEIEDTIMGFAMEECLTAWQGPSEDEACIQYEEALEDYGRLEDDYQKFLSECGITECGYWRDASPGA